MAALRMLIWVLLSVILAGEQADGYAHCKGCKFTTQDYAAFSDTAMSNAAASRSSVLLLAEGPRAGVRAANAESTLKLLGYSPSVRKLAQAGHTSARTDLNLWGNKQHAGLVLLAPHLQRLPDGITASSVLDFFDRGGSLVLTLSPHAGSLQRDVAASLGVDLSPNGSVFSRSTFASSEAHSLAHAILLGEHAQPDALSSVFSSNASGVDLSGCMPLGAPADSDTVLPVLPANGGSFAVTSDGLLVGSEASAAVAVQGRNGARALVLGSEQLLSRHGPLSHALLSWVMHETNTYRLSAFRHFPAGKRSLANPERYKINDLVDVEVDMERWDAEQKQWAPVDNISWLQVEWTMLDPHVRHTLRPIGNGSMGSRIKAPDVKGVFKWKVALRSLGASKVSMEQVCPIRPLRHDEFERFIPAAFPYYVSCIACMLAVLATTAIVLGSE